MNELKMCLHLWVVIGSYKYTVSEVVQLPLMRVAVRSAILRATTLSSRLLEILVLRLPGAAATCLATAIPVFRTGIGHVL